MRRSRQWACALLLLVVGLADVMPLAAASPSRGGGWQWPTSGSISQRYGCTGAWTNGRAGRCRHFHNGIDIANGSGTPIRAARAGVISHLGWSPYERRDRAWLVIINHGGGLRTWYAHMLPRRVGGALRGQRVEAGEIIGYMGSTGRATGVHLHFGVERGRRFVNPRLYLKGNPRGGGKRRRGSAGYTAAGGSGQLWLPATSGGHDSSWVISLLIADGPRRVGPGEVYAA